LTSIQDKAPLPVRLIPGVIGILLFLAAGGYIKLSSLKILLYLVPVPIIVAAIHLLKHAGTVDSRHSRESDTINYIVYEVESQSGSKEGLDRLVDLIGERSASSSVRYTIISMVEGGYSRSFIILSSNSPNKLTIESEVFNTLASSILSGVRVRRINDPGIDDIALHVSNLPLTRNAPIIIARYNGGTGSSISPDRIYIGEDLDYPVSRRIYIELSDVKGHIGVFGSTGSGKSTTLSILAKRVSEKGISVIIMDWTGEYARLLEDLGAGYREVDPTRGEMTINPFEAINHNDSGIIIDILSNALGLTQPQEYLLQRILEARHPRSISELMELIEAYPEESKWDREVKRGLARRIGVLARGQGKILFKNGAKTLIPGGLTIVRCDRIRNASVRTAYILMYLAHLYTLTPSREVLIVIDEAHNIFTKGLSGFPDQLIAESRKYGLYLALATQAPSEISNSVILNTNTKILHALKSARDKQLISSTLSLSQDDAWRLDKLKPGEALVDAPSLGRPVFVKIDLTES